MFTGIYKGWREVEGFHINRCLQGAGGEAGTQGTGDGTQGTGDGFQDGREAGGRRQLVSNKWFLPLFFPLI